jgi:integrase
MRHPKSPPKALTLEQIAAIRAAAKGWRTQPALPGPKPDGQVRDIIGVLLGTALRTGEVLALRPCDLDDRPTGMVLAVIGTVVQRQGEGAIRQHRPKSEASIRWIPVPEFAAVVLRRRAHGVSETRTVFANRSGGPLSPYNVRRTFRGFLVTAGLADSGISLRWYRRTGATVIARGMGSDAAAAFRGHSSTAITEGHYIERDRTIDRTPAAHLERTLRPVGPDGALLTQAPQPGRTPCSPRSTMKPRTVPSPSGLKPVITSTAMVRGRRDGGRSRRRSRPCSGRRRSVAAVGRVRVAARCERWPGGPSGRVR